MAHLKGISSVSMLLQYQSGHYYIIDQVITLLSFIIFSIRMSANFITFSGNYIIRCYTVPAFTY